MRSKAIFSESANTPADRKNIQSRLFTFITFKNNILTIKIIATQNICPTSRPTLKPKQAPAYGLNFSQHDTDSIGEAHTMYKAETQGKVIIYPGTFTLRVDLKDIVQRRYEYGTGY